MSVTEVPEFTKLAAFVNDFSNIGDLEKAKSYVKFLLSEHKLLSLLEHSNMNQTSDA